MTTSVLLKMSRAPPACAQKQPEPSGSQAIPARCDAATAVAPPSSSRPASAALTFEYHDCFLGRVLRVAVVLGLWLQIDAPLQFIQRAWWFHVQKTPLSLRTALHQRPPPVVDMQAALWPAQRARLMFSLTAMTCQRMSTAPGVPFRTACQWLWKTRVFSRVMARYVSKIQVRLAAAVQKLVLLVLLTALQQTRAKYRVRYGFVLELLRYDVRLTHPLPVFRLPLLLESEEGPAFIKPPRAVTLGSCVIISSPTPLLFTRKASGMSPFVIF